MKQQIIFLVCLLYFPTLQHKYVKQGIVGCVLERRMDQMPHPGIAGRQPRGIPVSVCIYPLVNISQVEPEQKASFYKAIHAPLVKMVEADSTGYFEASLDTGRYSLFIRVGNAYYAGLRDQYDHLTPVKVESSKQTYVELFYNNCVTQ